MEPGGQRVLVLLRPRRQGPGGRPEIRLPKGHVEPGESHHQAALREVREEAGLSEIYILDDLGYQTVEFDWQDLHHIRREHYFLMEAPNIQDTASAEEQFEPVWMKWKEALSDLTFEAEREWVRRARSAWENRQKDPQDGPR